MLNEQERNEIAAAIAEVERRTNGELVTVLAARSDDYGPAALLWAAVAALVVAPPLAFLELSGIWVVTVELALFCGLAVLFHFTPLGVRLMPESVRSFHAGSMARRQFIECGLHHTVGETGLLIFVSEAEHYVEILADRGIARHVDPARWQTIVDAFIGEVHAGRTRAGFVAAIAACGDILAEVCPKTPDNHNELDDRLILVGY